MPEEQKEHEEHHEHHEEHKQEKKSRMPKLKLTKWDYVSIIILVVAVVLLSLPQYIPKSNCEVARPGYECASFKDVMVENCAYWGQYSCSTQADASLPQIEWYISNLCKLQNQYHSSGLNCSNLKSACNQISEKQVCPLV